MSPHLKCQSLMICGHLMACALIQANPGSLHSWKGANTSGSQYVTPWGKNINWYIFRCLTIQYSPNFPPVSPLGTEADTSQAPNVARPKPIAFERAEWPLGTKERFEIKDRLKRHGVAHLNFKQRLTEIPGADKSGRFSRLGWRHFPTRCRFSVDPDDWKTETSNKQ